MRLTTHVATENKHTIFVFYHFGAVIVIMKLAIPDAKFNVVLVFLVTYICVTMTRFICM